MSPTDREASSINPMFFFCMCYGFTLRKRNGAKRLIRSKNPVMLLAVVTTNPYVEDNGGKETLYTDDMK